MTKNICLARCLLYRDLFKFCNPLIAELLLEWKKTRCLPNGNPCHGGILCDAIWSLH